MLKLSKAANYIILLLLLPSIFVFLVPGKIVAISILASYPLMAILILFLPSFNQLRFEGRLYVYLFVLSNLLIIGRGIVDAESQEDWKILFSQVIPIGIIFPLCVFLGVKNNILCIVFSSFFKYGILGASVLLLGSGLGMFGFPHNISPIYLFVIFIPYLETKWKIITLLVVVVSFFSELGMRANMLNILMAFLISGTFFFRRFRLMLSTIRFGRLFILIAPIVFMILGLTGQFNIFKIGELVGEYDIESENGSKQDIAIDSRTGIYLDVILELNKQEAFIWGLGGSGKTPTHLTEVEWGDFSEIYKEGRRATESGMLNYAQWGGVVAMIIYILLFAKASYLGVCKSKNWLMISIGLWVMYKRSFFIY